MQARGGSLCPLADPCNTVVSILALPELLGRGVDLAVEHAMHSSAAQRRWIIDDPADAVLELADAVVQARDPALSAGPIASGQVVVHLNEFVPVGRV